MQNFEKRLKYEKYKNMGNVITVDLHNGYTIIALIGKDESSNYDVELRLKANGVDKWDLIEKAEHLKFEPDISVHPTLLKMIGNYLKEGFFDYYIDRYEYELKCFDLGDELEENKRLGEVHAS